MMVAYQDTAADGRATPNCDIPPAPRGPARRSFPPEHERSICEQRRRESRNLVCSSSCPPEIRGRSSGGRSSAMFCGMHDEKRSRQFHADLAVWID